MNFTVMRNTISITLFTGTRIKDYISNCRFLSLSCLFNILCIVGIEDLKYLSVLAKLTLYLLLFLVFFPLFVFTGNKFLTFSFLREFFANFKECLFLLYLEYQCLDISKHPHTEQHIKQKINSDQIKWTNRKQTWWETISRWHINTSTTQQPQTMLVCKIMAEIGEGQLQDLWHTGAVITGFKLYISK